VTSIGNEAFSDNPSLNSVTIGNSVASIGNFAFHRNTALTSVTFLGTTAPPTVGEGAFQNVATGAKANVPYNATGFEPDILTGKWNGLTVTETVSCGSGGTFTIESNEVKSSTNDCAGTVNIPNGVEKIANLVFYERLITSVTIPNTVTEIGANAFESTRLVSLTIPDSVITLGTGVFQNITTLNYVSIGNSITTISDYAFSGTALTSVTIPNSVTRINNRAFYFISSLTSVTIGNSVDVIGPDAFRETGLTEVNIPDSVTSIGAGAFYGSTALTSVTFLGIAAPTVGVDAFRNVATGAKANVPYNATGFNLVDGLWNRLIVSYGSPPPVDSGSSSPSAITPVIVEAPDAEFNLKNKNLLENLKNGMTSKKA
jgi:hypothetical protein